VGGGETAHLPSQIDAGTQMIPSWTIRYWMTERPHGEIIAMPQRIRGRIEQAATEVGLCWPIYRNSDLRNGRRLILTIR